MDDSRVEDMLGKTIIKIVKNTKEKNISDRLTFWTSDGYRYEMYHEYDCSEWVYLEDINGDLDDLLGRPMLQSESVTDNKDKRGRDFSESFTWTFYKFATIRGYVTLRWLGESNGYYSEDVSIFKTEDSEELRKIRNEKLKDLGV